MSETNEPAFPVQDCAAFQYHGMSLRDYFAGQAVPTALYMACVDSKLKGSSDAFLMEWAAGVAYLLADAMLAEREKGK